MLNIAESWGYESTVEFVDKINLYIKENIFAKLNWQFQDLK